jgi:hypothetical protein
VATGHADGTIDVIKLRPPSETEFLYRRWKSAMDPAWHEQEASRHEGAERWFAAAFHLRQLLDHKVANADELKKRLKDFEDKLK